MEDMRPRVLIAEDEPDIRRLIAYEFDEVHSAIRIEFAFDGAAALDRYRKVRAEGGSFALVVLDASLPKLSGFEVAEEIRADCPDQALAFWTGDSEAMTSARASMLNAAFWPKHAHIMLRKCIEGAVQGKP